MDARTLAIGRLQKVCSELAELHAELGFGNFMLVTGFLGNLPQAQVIRTLELFAKEVMPRFQRVPEPVGSR